MTPGKLAHQFKNGLDVAFLVGVVFSLVLGGKIVPFLLVAGVAPIPFLLSNLRNQRLSTSPARLLVPASIYFTYVLLTYFFFTGLGPDSAKPVNPDLELYGVAIAMLLVGLLRGLEIDGLRRKFDLVVPWSLVASFAALSLLMFMGYRDECRVQGGAAWPFIPALLFGTLTFLSFQGWSGFTPRQRHFRLLLNALAIVVIISYTGSRGVAVAQAGVLFLLAAMAIAPRFRGTVPDLRQLALSVVGGIALCGLVYAVTGCGPLERIIPIFRTIGILSANAAEQVPHTSPSPVQQAPAEVLLAQQPAEAQRPIPPAGSPAEQAIMDTDMSIGQRLEMWKTSIHAIAEAPFFGHGALYLQHLITERYGFEHNHNQYLSWLVTGGLLGLSVGLLFLAIPWIITVGLSFPDRLIATLAISIFWGLAMMFDSYFNLKFYTHYYCLLCGLLFALVNDKNPGERRPESKS